MFAACLTLRALAKQLQLSDPASRLMLWLAPFPRLVVQLNTLSVSTSLSSCITMCLAAVLCM